MDRLVNVDAIRRAQEVMSPRVAFQEEKKEALLELARFSESHKLATILYEPLVLADEDPDSPKGGEETSRNSGILHREANDDLEGVRLTGSSHSFYDANLCAPCSLLARPKAWTLARRKN